MSSKTQIKIKPSRKQLRQAAQLKNAITGVTVAVIAMTVIAMALLAVFWTKVKAFLTEEQWKQFSTSKHYWYIFSFVSLAIAALIAVVVVTLTFTKGKKHPVAVGALSFVGALVMIADIVIAVFLTDQAEKNLPQDQQYQLDHKLSTILKTYFSICAIAVLLFISAGGTAAHLDQFLGRFVYAVMY